MTHEDVIDALCVHDVRSSMYNDLHEFDDPDEIPDARSNCYCDNCFYGRDELALEILRLREANRAN